jgi:hypothetical protein
MHDDEKHGGRENLYAPQITVVEITRELLRELVKRHMALVSIRRNVEQVVLRNSPAGGLGLAALQAEELATFTAVRTGLTALMRINTAYMAHLEGRGRPEPPAA